MVSSGLRPAAQVPEAGAKGLLVGRIGQISGSRLPPRPLSQTSRPPVGPGPPRPTGL